MDFSERQECWFVEEVKFDDCVSVLVVAKGRTLVKSYFAAIYVYSE